MKKLQEKSVAVEQIKIKITNMSKKKDFFKKSKTNNVLIRENNLTTATTNRDFEKSMQTINTSRMNSSFMDDFSHGFNSFWNKLLIKVNSRSKNNNILDSELA